MASTSCLIAAVTSQLLFSGAVSIGVRRTIKKLEFKLDKAVASGQESTAESLKKKIHFRQQKINKLDAKILELKESKEKGKFSVTFGSSRLLEKQYRLEENGYKNREEWLLDWRDARSAVSFFIGSKNYRSWEPIS